jgi:hypothetical protein
VDRGQRRKLVTKHIAPFCNQLLAERVEALKGREGNAFEAALSLYHVPDGRRRGRKITVTKEIDYVIKVARSGPFAQRADLFAKHFFECVATRLNSILRRIGIGMGNGPHDDRQH